MNQPSILSYFARLPGEGDSAKTPAESQHSQHDSDPGGSEAQQNYIQTSSLELDETAFSSETDGSSSGDDSDGNEPGLMPGNTKNSSFPRLRISKITINKKDKDTRAEEIISNITRQARKRKRKQGGETPRKKRRGTDGPINPQVRASDVQMESIISEGTPSPSRSQLTDGDNNEPGTSQPLDLATAVQRPTLKELALKKCVTDRLKEHESGFRVKLFECTTPIQCQISPAIEHITEPRQLQHVNQRISYMIFFYRDKDGPEIFVAVSGMAYLHVNQRSCPEFPKKIARRLLEPTTIQLDTRNVTGDTSQVRKQYIPDKGGKINIWDVMDVVVHKYTAMPKKMASILKFCDTWKVKRPSIAIKKLSVEVMARFPSIYCMQEIMSHFAAIDKNEPTYQFGSSQTVEKDDETFAMFDLMQEEHNKGTLKTLQENLHIRINRYLKNKSEDNIQLSSDDLDLWLKVSEYRLFLDTKSTRSPIKIWKESQPNFRDVLRALRKHIPSNEISGKMLHTDVKMSLRITGGKLCQKKPITSFIQSDFASSPSKPYYFWCGKWLKIKMEYFQILDDSFKSIMKEQTISSEGVLPLPWVHARAGKKGSGTKDAKKEKEPVKVTTKRFSLDSLQSFLADFLENGEVLDPQKIKMRLQSLCEVKEVKGGIVCSYQPKDHELDQDPCLQIFLRMHTRLTEGMYNDCYILLDKLISMSGNPLKTGFLVGDRKLIHGIEMFDIIMYNQTHTYIIHIKEGFDNNTRVVASQIRNSADILFRALTSHMTQTVLDEMWDRFTKEKTETSGRKSQPTLVELAKKDGMQKNMRAMKSKLAELTKEGFMGLFKEREIVYVLAARDKSKERTFETADPLVTQLQSELPKKYDKILQLLQEKMYVQEKQTDYVVTDKFGYTNQEDFLKDMKGTTLDNQGLGQGVWKTVYAILKAQLPDTKSSIVKLDLLSLFSHFRKYQIGERKFQLKVCFIPKSKEHFGEELRTFLKLKCGNVVSKDKLQVTP